MRKKSGVPELNQAKLGLVKLRQGCGSNFNVVVKCLQSTNFFLKKTAPFPRDIEYHSPRFKKERRPREIDDVADYITVAI